MLHILDLAAQNLGVSIGISVAVTRNPRLGRQLVEVLDLWLGQPGILPPRHRRALTIPDRVAVFPQRVIACVLACLLVGHGRHLGCLPPLINLTQGHAPDFRTAFGVIEDGGIGTAAGRQRRPLRAHARRDIGYIG